MTRYDGRGRRCNLSHRLGLPAPSLVKGGNRRAFSVVDLRLFSIHYKDTTFGQTCQSVKFQFPACTKNQKLGTHPGNRIPGWPIQAGDHDSKGRSRGARSLRQTRIRRLLTLARHREGTIIGSPETSDATGRQSRSRHRRRRRRDRARHGLLDLLAIPCFHDSLFSLFIGPWTYPQ